MALLDQELTRYGVFHHEVDRAPFVLPASTAGVVLDQTKQPTLVLTTCDPKFGASQRLIVTADRVSSSAAS